MTPIRVVQLPARGWWPCWPLMRADHRVSNGCWAILIRTRACEFYGSTERQFIACSAPNGRSLRAPSHAPRRYVAHRHRQQHLAHRPLFSTRASSAPRHRSAFVVDDGSTDRTGAAVRAAGADVLRLPFDLGVGGAMGGLPLRPYPWRHLRGSNECRRPARSGRDCGAVGRRRISGCRGRRPVRRPGQLPRPGTAPLGHALAHDAPEQGDRDTTDRPHVRISGCRAASYTCVCSALSRGVFGRHRGVVDHRAPSGTQYCTGAGGDAGANYGTASQGPLRATAHLIRVGVAVLLALMREVPATDPRDLLAQG